MASTSSRSAQSKYFQEDKGLLQLRPTWMILEFSFSFLLRRHNRKRRPNESFMQYDSPGKAEVTPAARFGFHYHEQPNVNYKCAAKAFPLAPSEGERAGVRGPLPAKLHGFPIREFPSSVSWVGFFRRNFDVRRNWQVDGFLGPCESETPKDFKSPIKIVVAQFPIHITASRKTMVFEINNSVPISVVVGHDLTGTNGLGLLVRCAARRHPNGKERGNCNCPAALHVQTLKCNARNARTPLRKQSPG